LHAGSAPVLAVSAMRLRRHAGEPIDPRALALSLAPPTLAGFLLERPIEERLGDMRSAAIAQVAAGAALLIADRRRGARDMSDLADHLAVGTAQAIALIPGVSRSGAALTAARLRGLSRPAALRLSLTAAVPVTMAAIALKGVRAVGAADENEPRASMLAGAGAAFASAVVALPLVNRLERARSYAPIAAYRVAIGALGLAAAARRVTPGSCQHL
jgi:undecaprenyl-diphosphatase